MEETYVFSDDLENAKAILAMQIVPKAIQVLAVIPLGEWYKQGPSDDLLGFWILVTPCGGQCRNVADNITEPTPSRPCIIA